MNNKFNNNIDLFKELQVFEECVHFCISSKDKCNKVVGSKQAFFEISIDTARFPVLKSCRILRRHIDNNKDFDIESTNYQQTNNTDTDNNISKQKMDQIDKMIDANLPSTLQEHNNVSTLRATAEDDDDVTVQTSNSTKPKQAWKSYNIKLLLTSKQDTSDSALQHAMLTILETMDRELGIDVKIFDRNKQQLTDFQFQSVMTF
jgi:hypothetical protein